MVVLGEINRYGLASAACLDEQFRGDRRSGERASRRGCAYSLDVPVGIIRADSDDVDGESSRPEISQGSAKAGGSIVFARSRVVGTVADHYRAGHRQPCRFARSLI